MLIEIHTIPPLLLVLHPLFRNLRKPEIHL